MGGKWGVKERIKMEKEGARGSEVMKGWVDGREGRGLWR